MASQPMKWTLSFSLSFSLSLVVTALLSYPSAATEQLEPLELIQAVALEGRLTEPSGLSYCQGALLMVSDSDQRKVFRLEPDSNPVVVIDYLTLMNIPSQPVPLQDERGYDWEGIACDNEENIYLMSEALGNILVIKYFKASHWLDIPIYDLGKELGFFSKKNAGAEGLAVIGESEVAIAAERSKPGLLVVEKGTKKITKHLIIPTPQAGIMAEDVSDLHIEGNKIYTLQRFHSKICRRDLNSEAMKQEVCWSFKHVEKAENNLYQESFYGKAEGLTRIENKIFVVLDNNGQHRKNNHDDRRPLLFAFERPSNW